MAPTPSQDHENSIVVTVKLDEVPKRPAHIGSRVPAYAVSMLFLIHRRGDGQIGKQRQETDDDDALSDFRLGCELLPQRSPTVVRHSEARRVSAGEPSDLLG